MKHFFSYKNELKSNIRQVIFQNSKFLSCHKTLNAAQLYEQGSPNIEGDWDFPRELTTNSKYPNLL